MLLQTLDSLESLHGHAIAARLEPVSGGALRLTIWDPCMGKEG